MNDHVRHRALMSPARLGTQRAERARSYAKVTARAIWGPNGALEP
jgi:hypothetical protein